MNEKSEDTLDPAGETEVDAVTDTGEAAAAAEGAELSAEQIVELQSQAGQAVENWEKYVRACSELDNFRKRAARERQEAIRYANESLLEKLIPVLDNFEAALVAANNADAANVASLKTGVEMICGQLKSVIRDAGLEEIDASGQAFDPTVHEAVSHQDSSEVEDGHVLQQLRKGYRLKDRLIRAATVVVARKPGEEKA